MDLTKNWNLLSNTTDVNDHDADHLHDPIYQNIPCLRSAAEKKPPAPSAAPFTSCRRHHFPAAASTTETVSAFRESASARRVQKYDPLFVKCSQSSSSKTEHATLPALIAEASAAYALGDLETALRAYQRVLRAEPCNNVLHANISAILLRMDDACKQQALEAAERAIQLMPDWPKAHFRRGEALSALARLDEAVLAHAEAFQLSDGQDEQFRSALIGCATLNGAAGETFENVFAQHQLEGGHEDDGCDLLNSVAEFFRMSEKPEFALRLLRIAAKMTSNTTAAQLCLKKLAILEIEMGNWKDGLKAIERQLEIAKTLGDEFTQMSMHGEMSKLLANKLLKPEAAIKHCGEEIRLATKLAINPNHFRLELANLQLNMRNVGQAQQIFKQILEEEPTNPGALYGLGQAFYIGNELHSALTMFNRVEKLALSSADDQSSFWHDSIALGKCHCYIARGDTDKALNLSEKLLKSSKNNSVKFGTVMARGLMALGKLPEAMRWAKRMLTAQIHDEQNVNLTNAGNMVVALYTVMALYARMCQWKNAGKVADQLLNRLANCLCQPNAFGPSPEGILEEISQIQRQLNQHEQIERSLELRIKLAPKFTVGWAKIVMEMAKMHFERANWDNQICADLIQRLETWTEKHLGPVEMELNPDSTRVRWEVDLLTMKAELAHQNAFVGKGEVAEAEEASTSSATAVVNAGGDADDGDDPFTLLETALMLAQESALTDAEADICLRLGEWHANAGAQEEEAIVYLRQVIALERQMVEPVNQSRLLRAYSALAEVLCAQRQWEDAFAAARCKLGIQKAMAVPLLDRLGTQLLMGKILLEPNRPPPAELCRSSSSSNEEKVVVCRDLQGFRKIFYFVLVF
ncbi:Tetratricopeptide repeat protein 28, variant 3 [Globodera pallida]|nr:Tetratricopeptide repeat protein 28, variant 3 [Globodera pallida]